MSGYLRAARASIMKAGLAVIALMVTGAALAAPAAAASDPEETTCTITGCVDGGFLGVTETPPPGFESDGVTPSIKWQGGNKGSKRCMGSAKCRERALDAERHCTEEFGESYEAYIFLKGSRFAGFKCVEIKER